MRTVITEGDIPLGGELRVAVGSIITPSARDAARERGVRILELPPEQVSGIASPDKTVALGADHGGFALKELLKPVFAGLGLEVRDVGVHQETPADYPDIAEKVAVLVAGGKAARGVIVDGAGIGSAMAANKVPGVRAALCYDKASARNSREHNHANVLTLGGRLLTPTQAEEVLRTWLATPYGGGRHEARVDKIALIERRHAGDWPPCRPCVTHVDPELAGLIDHTLLKPEATADDIRRICAEARRYCFASVCINPYWVPLAAGELRGSAVKVCTVVGFPLGASATEIKRAEAEAAARDGAREIDMVINVGALRSGDLDTVERDIRAVCEASHRLGAIVKVILETALLDDRQKETACVLAQRAGADFVKTSTGFGPGGATAEDVALMRRTVGPEMGVKAAGGIRTLEDLRNMAAAGATRIGASASVGIVEGAAGPEVARAGAQY